ncbi:MAG TPA: hypothetical protein VFN20_01970 [Candidatus Acidoferrum sp.]|nr:hypothetical protein [Candidatus Acidoferrum sp.]
MRTPFGRLTQLFAGRMLNGRDESNSGDLDLGVGVMVSLMAAPGLLVSLLTFEKYGSLIRFLNGSGAFDPFTATIADDYFFVVLSLVVSGAAALWRWDAIFLDRRDYTNLVPLPVGLRTIFLANLCAILFLTGLFTFVANIASAVLFPLAVVGSQNSASVFFHFVAGHLAGVLAAGAFGCLAVFALTGLLMALLPASFFRRISHLVRFCAVVILLALVASSFAVPELLSRMSIADAHRLALLPPFSFLGLTRTVWGRGSEAFVPEMFRAALIALVAAFGTAMLAYAASFRRSFLRIPELPDAGPLPRSRVSFSPLTYIHRMVLREPSQRACYDFVVRTLLRSESHVQILAGFAALGLVLAANALSSAPDLRALVTGKVGSVDVLSAPFVLSFCMVAGVRFAFEIPADLQANWVFRFWLHGEGNTRATARYVLLVLSIGWLAPLTFLATLFAWGWTTATLHTLILALSTGVAAEISLLRFRKMPFTCSYPPFRSHSGLVVVVYLFAFLFFTGYLVEIERWSLLDPWRALYFVPLCVAALAGVHYYRGQMLAMDKQLMFDEVPTSAFW